ncbi:hypothetical protein [Corynebacterium macclintockiae]|uniref:hypothetical protein n=1 Tax=Corynebacterium macclintockiae TaxID=2913501 RepID=UPI00254DC756|nr:hypothetical protein [Corynebacterium macclintockiae]MDK8889865.1 hypothetical protein [Corynebacterium macclintockiae]
MTWMTKDLTVKLLEIAITGLVNAHDTIKNENPTPQPQPATPEPAAPQAEDIPDPAPTPTMPEIQNALRTIAQTEGTNWILNDLFKGLDITNITNLPQEKLPLAWQLITTHLDEIKDNQ